MRAYVINIMVVLIIFPIILQTVINVIMLSIGGQGEFGWWVMLEACSAIGLLTAVHIC